MNMKRFAAPTTREAMALVRAAFGNDAVVLSTKPCPAGIEVLAMGPEGLAQVEATSVPRLQASPRDDVNAQVLGSDPLLKFISTEVLPITAYRPSSSDYTQVSTAIQTATGKVASGGSADQAANDYQKALEGIVGGSDKTFN